jgi:hypothetical protein
MMPPFYWDSLRRGDRILVHDPKRADLGLRPAEVAYVEAPRSGHRVGVRYTSGTDTGRVVWPSRFAAHFDPVSEQEDCWRCEELRLAS